MIIDTKERLIFRRLIAGIYDFFLMLGVWFVIGSLFLILNSREILHPYFGLLITFLSAWLFFGYFWARSGQTLGMSVWKIKLVPLDGDRITKTASFIRLLANCLTLLSLGSLLLYSFIDKDGLTIADRASKTKIIKI
ncbi:MAG: RDD family protein [Gammaproteobacteria bacterium]